MTLAILISTIRVESNKEPLQEASRTEMAKALEQVLGKYR